MFRILFATDGSDSAQHAQELLRRLPLEGNAVLRLVTVVSPPDSTFQQGWRAYGLADSAERAWAESVLNDTAGVLMRQRVEVSSDARAGDIAREIIEAARQWEADLVIVGAQGLSGLRAFLLGSIARNVAHHAPCSVLVARAPRADLRHVVLGTDGSDHAERALDVLARLPLPEETSTAVVSVVRPYQPVPTLLPVDAYAVEQAAQEIRDAQSLQSQQVLQEAAARLEAAGKQVHTSPRFGDPASELLDEAEKLPADLVIVGARGASLIEGLFMGSVADRVLKDAHCSVLIAR